MTNSDWQMYSPHFHNKQAETNQHSHFSMILYEDIFNAVLLAPDRQLQKITVAEESLYKKILQKMSIQQRAQKDSLKVSAFYETVNGSA